MTCSRSTILAIALATAAGATPPVSAAIRSWEPSDYVRTDIVLHYDGIRNAGADAAHDSSATAWKDLSGNGRNATLTSGSGSAWRADGTGFHFAKTAWFATSGEFSLGTSYTIEVLSDFKGSDNSANAMKTIGDHALPFALGNQFLKLADEALGHTVFSDHAVIFGLHDGTECLDVDIVEAAALLLLGVEDFDRYA